MGPKGAEWCAGLNDYAAMVILADDTVLSTPAISRYRAEGPDATQMPGLFSPNRARSD
jgi:hypothetical protein